MAPIDSRGDTWAVAMLGLDRLGEPRIVGPQFQLQRPALHREPLLQLLQPGFLVRVERELVMQHVVQLRAGLGTWRK